ncbi:hypothetical protein JW756_04195 [Candidatus Woesearchaeota archaeon]|nr:hypothetical protein [Candidatus Woesearchaeota archaeon]
MNEGLETLANMEYPGRVIILGMSPQEETVVLYAITGRSLPSQARRMEVDRVTDFIHVNVTDPELLKKGNPDLLIYPAIYLSQAIVVSNGKQTLDIKRCLETHSIPTSILMRALVNWKYEPDEPNYTPRISGVANCRGGALSIIKRASDGSVNHNYFEVPYKPGTGRMISTYTGQNIDPIPSFKGEPFEVNILWNDVLSAVNAVYDALAPNNGKPDFRVSVAGVYYREKSYHKIFIKNRADIVEDKKDEPPKANFIY